MSYTFSFADNGVYSAADVNKITSRLVTSGIEDPFTDGVPYNLSAFNEAGTLLYTDGVVPETVNTLKVTKAEEDGSIFIYPGTAFFSDGSVIEVEAGGETLAYTPGVAHYVYLKNDLINSNTSYPTCTQEAPTGIYVMLAEISETGEVTDKRTYARGKLPGYASCADNVLTITDSVTIQKGDVSRQKTYDIGDNRYRYLVLYNEGETEYGGDQRINYALGIYSFETGKLFSCRYSRAQSTDRLYLGCKGDAYAYAKVSCADGKLILDITGNTWVYDWFGADYTMYLF